MPRKKATDNDNNKMSYALLGDVPILEGSRKDLLKFDPCATVLGRAAIETEESITIGIYGKWGTGKTSMMRLIMEKIKQEENVVPVWFNAWQFEKEEHLIVPLTDTITRELDKKLKDENIGEDILNIVKNLRDALRSIAFGFTIKGKMGIPGLAGAEVQFSGKDAIMRSEKLMEESIQEELLQERSFYFKAFEKLTTCAESGGNKFRIVVLIDDLDRCFPSQAVALLESIKLVLTQPGFSFVIGVHDQIIRGFIRTKYKQECGIDAQDLEDYLDKIVQVKIPVPIREPENMHDYIATLLKQADIFKEKEIADLVNLIAESCNRNPRSVVRLLNRIMVTIRINLIEGKDCEPTALILDMATDGDKYKHFKSILDDTIIVDEGEGRESTFSELIALTLEKNDSPTSKHLQGWEELRNIKLKSRSMELEKVSDMLRNNPHIISILKTNAGLQWLKNPEYRRTLGLVAKQTLGESKRELDIGDKSVDPTDNNMVNIPGGSFLMGDKENGPIHEVTISSFHISALPVTQKQYMAVMGHNPSKFKDDENKPVENVSWEDAKKYCEKLSQRTGKKYDLPTEAQWEYACRAGSQSAYCFGDNIDSLDDYGWYDKNSNGSTQPVGKKRPNKFGLYDMHGNVWEWCNDWFGDNYYDQCKETGVIENPKGPETGSDRVLRGGSWNDGAGHCRCANRYHYAPVNRLDFFGFRVVFVP